MVQSVGNMALGRVSSCCRSLLHEPNRRVLCGVFQSGWIERCAGAKRYLLKEDVVGLQDFQQRKLLVAKQHSGSKKNYIERLKQKLQENKLILEEQLKLLLHLCETADDMKIARDAIYRHAENHTAVSGEYNFGPVFMRLCYELGLEEMAFTTITDEKMRGFFRDTTSFNLAMYMQFTKGSYENSLEVLQTMKRRKKQVNKDTLILATGTCYKINTPESYRICISLIEECQSKGYFVPRRAFCFGVALALRQNDHTNAQSLCSQIMSTDGILYQNLQVLLLTMSGAIADALNILSEATVSKSLLLVRKPEFSQELVNLLRLRCEDGPHTMEMEKIVSQLERANQVSQQTIDEMLCYTPTAKRKPKPMMNQKMVSRRAQSPLRSSLMSE